MTYEAKHRGPVGSPPCTCCPTVHALQPGAWTTIHSKVHMSGCAIVAERHGRLRIGTGGTR